MDNGIEKSIKNSISKNLHRSRKEDNIAFIDYNLYKKLLEKYGYIKVENGKIVSVTCAYTGKEYTSNEGWELDHIIAHNRTGGTINFNLVPSDDFFNNSKSNKEVLTYWMTSEYFNYDRLNNLIAFSLESLEEILKSKNVNNIKSLNSPIEEENDSETVTDSKEKQYKNSYNNEEQDIELFISNYKIFLVQSMLKLYHNSTKYKEEAKKYCNKIYDLNLNRTFDKLKKNKIYYDSLINVLIKYNVDNPEDAILNFNIIKFADSFKTTDDLEKQIEKRIEKIKEILNDEAYFITYLKNISKIKHHLDEKQEINSNIRDSLINQINQCDKWALNYNLAKVYYEHHGNLEIPQSFKTINGYEYDENGVNLGRWIATQRQAYKGKGTHQILPERIKLLEQIGMRFEIRDNDLEWNKNYQLAKAYYKHHGYLEIKDNFKTLNGYEYDENGVKLGRWIATQRQAYKGKGTRKISPEQNKLLEQIGMRFETSYYNLEWNKNYQLAKAYYEHKGNLEIPISFKTINGYEYDENGVNLGKWVTTQRQSYNEKGSCKITPERIKLLEQIGMRFEISYYNLEWNKNYQLAKAYYEHKGNLEISKRFKTSNGYEYDENGVNLGVWITTQRNAYNGKGRCKISLEQIELLNDIHMRWTPKKTYKEAKKELTEELAMEINKTNLDNVYFKAS